MNANLKISGPQKAQLFAEINKKSDYIMTIALTLYFVFGLGLSFFYDTYLIAVGVGGLCLTAYFFTKKLLPNAALYRYVLAVIVGILTAQFIYQMHGLFELHFFFFVGSALLITYQDWRLQIPLLVFVVLHHASFAYLQYSGMKEIYFTQLDYMDLQTFIFHAAIAGVILFINGLWGYNLGKKTLSEIQAKSQLEIQVKNIKNNIAFAEEISKGNLTMSHELSSDDELGKSLMAMQQNLLQSSKRERAERYITQGIASVGEILRNNTDNMEHLSLELISDITKYTKSNQGGIFILEKDSNEDEYLKLMACYAYDRQKFLTKRVEIGESLVGQCFLEKEIIIMTQVPKDYVKITSGLGLATPSCLILVPLVSNDEVVGVMEFASFDEYDEGTIEFLQKSSEAIASSLLSVRTTQRIKTLLADSQQQAEEMRSQEEEMRQNMEELSATQEEMLRSAGESESRVDAINESGIASIEFNLDGTITTANASFLKLMGYSLEEIKGRHHRIFVTAEYASQDEYARFWEDLSNGIAKPGEYERVRKDKTKVYINGSYSIIRNKNGNPERILKLATDMTVAHQLITTLNQQDQEMHEKAIEMENRIRAINESGISSVEFGLDGTILNANEHFLKLMGYSLGEVKGRHHSIFVSTDYALSPDYAIFWNQLRNGVAQPGVYNRINKAGMPVAIKGSYSIIRDHSNNPARILKLATEVEIPTLEMQTLRV